MTSHPSSISSFEFVGYLGTLAITLGVLVVVLVSITAMGYHFGLVEVANHEIYEYQRDKVGAQRDIDVVFVGDSSLGNAIDATRFESLSGLATVNLALNGSYGSGGAYNMSYKVLQHHTPKLIVIMQSIDVMRRREAFAGFYFSAEPSQLMTTSPVRILELYFSLKTARRVVEHLFESGSAKPSGLIVGDYIGQAKDTIGFSPTSDVDANPLLPNMIAQSQLDYVGQLADLCRQQGTRCVFAFGPIYDGYCSQATEYVEEVRNSVSAKGLPVIDGTPVCVPASELGDTVDHVRPDLKQSYSQRYFELLQPYL